MKRTRSASHSIELWICLLRSWLLDEYLSQTALTEDNIDTLNQRLQPLVRLFESK